MELDNIKVELYSALGKPKSYGAKLEMKLPEIDNDFYSEFIARLSWFEDNKKVGDAKYFTARNCLKTRRILRDM